MTDKYGVIFWGDSNVLKFVVMVTQLCEYTINKKPSQPYTLSG